MNMKFLIILKILSLLLLAKAQETLSTLHEGTVILDNSGEIQDWGKLWATGEYADAPTGPFESICSGHYHSCVLTSAQVLTCWGKDEFGVMTKTPSSGTYSQVSCGCHSSCALDDTTNYAKCWGRDDQLQSTNTPTNVEFSWIGSGCRANCAIKVSDSSIQCWGQPANPINMDVPTAGTYVSVVVGLHYACAFNTDGGLVCWGEENTTKTNMATAAAAYSDKSFYQIGTGYCTVCAIEVSTNLLYCWGNDNYNQITNKPTFAVLHVSSGDGYHFCAVKASDNSLICWGKDNFNQVTHPNAWTGTTLAATITDECLKVPKDRCQGICTDTCKGMYSNIASGCPDSECSPAVMCAECPTPKAECLYDFETDIQCYPGVSDWEEPLCAPDCPVSFAENICVGYAEDDEEFFDERPTVRLWCERVACKYEEGECGGKFHLIHSKSLVVLQSGFKISPS